MSDDKPKVISLELRRQQQLKKEGRFEKDPVMVLADEITKLLGEQQGREASSNNPLVQTQFAVNQLVAIGLASDAILALFVHTLGHVRLNEVLVEVERKRRLYKVEWPQHEQTKTYMDRLPTDEDQSDAQVVHLSRGHGPDDDDDEGPSEG